MCVTAFTYRYKVLQGTAFVPLFISCSDFSQSLLLKDLDMSYRSREIGGKYSENSPLGHLCSGDTSIQVTQNMVPKKCSHNLWFCYLYSRDTPICSIQGKGHLLWVTHVFPPSRGYKIWSLKNVHIIFGSVTFIQGIPLSALSRERDTFCG